MWTEIDRDEGVWTNYEHRVPLCHRAAEILDAARALRQGSPLVFPSSHGKPFGDLALRGLLKDLEVVAVPHRFRSSFRHWAAEETNHPHEAAEMAVAHVVRNQVEATYGRTDLFDRRRRLMEDWAAYLAGESRDPEAGSIR